MNEMWVISGPDPYVTCTHILFFETYTLYVYPDQIECLNNKTSDIPNRDLTSLHNGGFPQWTQVYP